MAKGAAAALAVVAGLYGVSCPALAQASGEEPEIAAEPVTDDNYPERRVVFSGDVIGLPDLTYSTRSGFRPLKLDLYLPPDSMPKPEAGFPLVAHIYGGGWMAGHPRHSGAFADFPAVLASLAAKGYVVASVAYRLSGEAPSPAAVIDVKTAIRWLRSKADEYGIDPDRAITWGGSAGGPACRPDRRELRDRGVGPRHPAAGGRGRSRREAAYQYAAARASGVPAELILIPEIDHSFIGGTHAETRTATLISPLTKSPLRGQNTIYCGS